jgi:PHD-finger
MEGCSKAMAPSVPPPTLKKYLCLAPRPEEWEERAQAILRSNVTKDHIQRTLSKLYKMHPNLLLLFSGGVASSGLSRSNYSNTHPATKLPQPPALPLRTGPGRKSNAEYAIQFYEYLLQLFNEHDSKEAIQEDLIGLDEESDEKHHDEATALDTADESDKDEDDSSRGDDDIEEYDDHHAPASADHRKDVCAVCANEPGNSHLSCSKCILVFHLSCVRPKLDHIPPVLSGEQGWLCSYCVLAETKRNTKQRKQAAAAVRYMARLRKFHQRNSAMTLMDRGDRDTSNSDDKIVDSVDQNTEGKTNVEVDVHSKVAEPIDGPSDDSQSQRQDAGSAVCMEENSREVSQVATGVPVAIDTFDTKEVDVSDSKKRSSSDVATSPQRSSKRCRKQPTLYDPQVVAASRWQTDELTEWKLARVEASGADSDDTSNPEDGTCTTTDVARPAISTSARKLLRDKSDGIWCNFCRDDPDVPLCVFCACRVCFGKHKQTQLLLCDQCDEEYHTFCLDPPMTAFPDMKRWYCPICAKANSRKQANSTIRSSRRNSIVDLKSRESTVTVSASAADAGGGQRRSQRSPKPPFSMMMLTSPAKNDTIKNEKKSSDAKSKADSKSIKRPRGRPPKNDSSASYSTTKSPNRTISNLSMSDHTSSGDSSSSRTSPNPVSSSTSRRKPGRPPGTPRRSTSEHPRKRGRPPSESTLAKRAKIEISQKSGGLETRGLLFSPKGSTSSVIISTMHAASKNNDVATLPVSSGATSTVDSPQETLSLPVKVSRSGRTVRRSNFHDEVVEGAQHLKSVRSANNLNSDPSPHNASSDPAIAPSESTQSPDKAASVVSTGAVVYSGTTLEAASVVGARKCCEKQSLKRITDDHIAHESETSSLSQPIAFPNSSPAATIASGPMDSTTTSDPAHSVPSVAVSSFATAAVSIGETLNQTAQAKEDALKQPRRKPGARECMQISRRFGVKEIPQQYMDTLLDYCNRGKVEHLIRMRERLDEHSRYLEMQLAGLESLVLEHGESDIVVPLAPPSPDRRHE